MVWSVSRRANRGVWCVTACVAGAPPNGIQRTVDFLVHDHKCNIVNSEGANNVTSDFRPLSNTVRIRDWRRRHSCVPRAGA